LIRPQLSSDIVPNEKPRQRTCARQARGAGTAIEISLGWIALDMPECQFVKKEISGGHLPQMQRVVKSEMPIFRCFSQGWTAIVVETVDIPSTEVNKQVL
jgi:hypothetical protein